MERVKFIFRQVAILLMPLVVVFLSAIIWQNNDIIIAKFLLVGGWWSLEKLRISSLLVFFALFGAALTLSFIMLLKSERKLRRELTELRSRAKAAERQERQRQTKVKPSEPKSEPEPDAGAVAPTLNDFQEENARAGRENFATKLDATKESEKEF